VSYDCKCVGDHEPRCPVRLERQITQQGEMIKHLVRERDEARSGKDFAKLESMLEVANKDIDGFLQRVRDLERERDVAKEASYMRAFPDTSESMVTVAPYCIREIDREGKETHRPMTANEIAHMVKTLARRAFKAEAALVAFRNATLWEWTTPRGHKVISGSHASAIELGDGTWHCDALNRDDGPVVKSKLDAARFCTGLDLYAVDPLQLRVPEEPPGYVSPRDIAIARKKLFGL
jgi:hypothetical protein